MVVEAIKQIMFRLVEEIWNKSNFVVADGLLPDQAITPYQPDLFSGPDGLKAFVSGFRLASPDLQVVIKHRVTDGNFVATLTNKYSLALNKIKN